MAVLLVTLVTLCVIAILFRFYAKYKLNYWKRKGVDQLPTDVIFGNLKDALLFRSAPGVHLGDLHKAAKSKAPFLGFYIFHKPCLLLRDPDLIKQIIIKDFDNFTDRHFAGFQQKDSLGMQNLFGLKNPAWKYVRSKITPTFTRGKLRQITPMMTDVGEPMMDFLDSQRPNENGIRKTDAQSLIYKYTTDLIGSVCLGTKFNSFLEPDTEFSTGSMHFFHGFKRMIALAIVFFIPEVVKIFRNTVLFNVDFIKKVFWQAIERREQSGIKRGDFIDLLLQLKNGEQNDVFEFKGHKLFSQCGTFFSGFESSSSATAFTLLELANNVEYQRKAREDINRAIEKHGLTYEAFIDMKYLDQCLAEGVRLYPPVSTLDRYTKKNYKIPGTDIILEKGTAVFVALYGLQQDPRYFKESTKFNPDRFSSKCDIPDAYMPFGLGPRMCIGMKMGQMHAKVVLAMILREYEVSQLSEDKSYQDNRSTLTTSANGVYLEFKKVNETED